MKFRVTLKDPDVLHDAINEAVVGVVNKMIGLDADERDAVVDRRQEKIAGLCSQWFRYGEYLTVEIDTDAQTCVVVAGEEA